MITWRRGDSFPFVLFSRRKNNNKKNAKKYAVAFDAVFLCTFFKRIGVTLKKKIARSRCTNTVANSTRQKCPPVSLVVLLTPAAWLSSPSFSAQFLCRLSGSAQLIKRKKCDRVGIQLHLNSLKKYLAPLFCSSFVIYVAPGVFFCSPPPMRGRLVHQEGSLCPIVSLRAIADWKTRGPTSAKISGL